MFTLNQTLIQPPFFRKRISDWSYIFKRLFPLLLVCFVTFSISTSGQTKDGYSDQCGCGTYRECKFKGPDLVCPGSSATFCIRKKVQDGYYYRWSVKGDGCYVPAPSECKYSCVTVRAKNSCWASYTVKLKIYDKYGKKVSECKKVVWVGDKQKPVLTGCPSNASYQCLSQVPPPATVTASDNCDKYVKVYFHEYKKYYSSCYVVITRTWTAEDKCGNKATCTQIITVNDVTPPTFTDCPANLTVQCYSNIPSVPTLHATDNCGGYVTIAFLGQWQTKQGSSCCNNVITRKWSATDVCGNKSYCTQTITVNDNTPPTFTDCPASITVQCYSNVPSVPTLHATDNCGGYVTIAFLGEWQTKQGSSCNNVITRKWSATDVCGNTSYCTQTITVNDNTPPTFTDCPASITVQCYSNVPSVPTLHATDNCGGYVTIAFLGEWQTKQGSSCNNVITRKWSATDVCGNTSYCTQTITVNDTTPPVFYNCPTEKVVVKTCDNDIEFPCTIYATDNCGGKVTYKYKIKEIYDENDNCDACDNDENDWYDGKWDDHRKFDCFKKFIVIIKAIDECGNVSKCRFKLIVKRGDDCHDTYAGGCSHGYWKKYDIHPYPSCAKPTDSYSTTFGVTLTPDLTLDQALDYRGGGSYGVVIRDGVAALLNSCANLKYPYAFTTTEVVALIKGAFSSGNYDDAASKLSSANDDESGKIKCDFSNQNSPIASRSSATGKPELSNSDEKVITVSASPIPFEDRIRFVIKSKISGPATLDAYSLLGQKLSNIYKGNVHAGRTQTVDFNVPVYMRTNMVYRLRIADKEVAGKILKK